uniref:Uncharacterized protein n=1 Tax=Tanacetum cinerariifolium TaxID=118510 RepID=A0A6L2J492_TANCI|nr:hypothetical protein [Tanacetum cinerariifolium]
MSDITACLNDLSYIPLNNEQNEPTQGDIGETSNEPTQAKRNEFEELYASPNEELYPSCDYVTRLDFMAKFTYFKVKGKLTVSIFNEMREFFQNVIPTDRGFNLLPSYYAIKKTFKKIGLGYESIHACVNDCFLFWGDANKDVHFWPVCNMSRRKDSNTLGNKVLKKVFHPFGNLSQSYIMWSVILTTYNLPLWLCMKESSFTLTLLIHVPKSLGKDIDVYVRPLIDDLNDLWAKPDVDAPPDIIDVDEDDDIIDEEDPIPHDLADSDDKDLVNLDIDDGVNVSADASQGHDGDGGDDDRPPSYQIPTGCGGCLGKGTRKPNLGSRRAGRMHTRQENRNLRLKAIIHKNGPVPIRFEFGDRETQMPFGDHAGLTTSESSLGSCRYTTHLSAKCSWSGRRGSWQRSGICKRSKWQEGCSKGKMSVDVAQSHGGDGGGDDRPPPYQIPTGYKGCLHNRGKGTRKPKLGGRRAGRMHTHQETRNLGLKAITDKNGLISLGSCRCTTFLAPNAAGAEGGGRDKDWGKPSLTYVPTWNPIVGHKSMRSSSSICKRSTMAKRLLSKKGIGFLARTGLTTWSASDADIPRTFPR